MRSSGPVRSSTLGAETELTTSPNLLHLLRESALSGIEYWRGRFELFKGWIWVRGSEKDDAIVREEAAAAIVALERKREADRTKGRETEGGRIRLSWFEWCHVIIEIKFGTHISTEKWILSRHVGRYVLPRYLVCPYASLVMHVWPTTIHSLD